MVAARASGAQDVTHPGPVHRREAAAVPRARVRRQRLQPVHGRRARARQGIVDGSAARASGAVSSPASESSPPLPTSEAAGRSCSTSPTNSSVGSDFLGSVHQPSLAVPREGVPSSRALGRHARNPLDSSPDGRRGMRFQALSPTLATCSPTKLTLVLKAHTVRRHMAPPASTSADQRGHLPRLQRVAGRGAIGSRRRASCYVAPPLFR